KSKKKPQLSLKTAFALSFRNLMTKRLRTFLTAFAGSIGIIGIALILAMSNGMQNYIDGVEQETLAGFPVRIEQHSMDANSMFAMMGIMNERGDTEGRQPGYIYSDDLMGRLLNSIIGDMHVNDMRAFKAFLESGESDILYYVSEIRYGYSTELIVFRDTEFGLLQVNPNILFEQMGLGYVMDNPMAQLGMPGQGGMMDSIEVWTELHSDAAITATQFDVITGRLPQAFNEIVIIVDRHYGINDFALYSMGLKDPSHLTDIIGFVMLGEDYVSDGISFTFNEFMNLDFRLIPNTDFFAYTGDGIWADMRNDLLFIHELFNDAIQLEIVGIVQPSEGAVMMHNINAVGYLPSLMVHLIELNNQAAIVQQQLGAPDINVLTGRPFGEEISHHEPTPAETMQMMIDLMNMSEEERMMFMLANMPQPPATFDSNLLLFGVADIANPSTISIYPRDFAAKDVITSIIADYNARMESLGFYDRVIHYTDMIGMLFASISTIINAISYVLISFVAISLVVSSIMIGIITYISVLERTKEIGILRSIGASKRDISRVFNAETATIGLTAGAIGIGVTLLVIVPANIIIAHYANIQNVASLPFLGAVILITVSVLLTLIAGLIPSKIAAKKDPVVALRSE
ncbi:MAG: ABC transporter permease, partial [Defluviitaleaceae bacterium]|nr:ABC transporter permease [Defluviitaleaceae bacterium]